MKSKILILLCLIGFIVGCRKNSDPIPTLEDYYGTYEGTVTDIKTGIVDSGTIKIIVGKSITANELNLQVSSKTSAYQLKAILTNDTFIITEKTFYATNAEQTFKGDGTFSNKILKMTFYSSGRDRSSSSSSWYYYSEAYKLDLVKK
jgi:hypothetical protein